MISRDEIDPFAVMAYHYMNVVSINGCAQNQTAGERLIIFILFDNLPGINTPDYVINRYAALHQAAAGMFCDGYLFCLVQCPKLFNIYHVLDSFFRSILQ